MLVRAYCNSLRRSLDRSVPKNIASYANKCASEMCRNCVKVDLKPSTNTDVYGNREYCSGGGRETSMFFDVLPLTYHSPITIVSLTERALVRVAERSSSTSSRAGRRGRSRFRRSRRDDAARRHRRAVLARSRGRELLSGAARRLRWSRTARAIVWSGPRELPRRRSARRVARV